MKLNHIEHRKKVYLWQTYICVVRLTLERNRFQHLEQTNCSPMPCFSRMWIFRLSARLNAWPHTWHRHNTGSARWHIFWWRVRFPAWLNNFPHTVQAYFPATALLGMTFVQPAISALFCNARMDLWGLQYLGLSSARKQNKIWHLLYIVWKKRTPTFTAWA